MILFLKRNDSKKKNGAVGILTNNLIDRTKYYEEAVVLSLIPFIKNELFVLIKTFTNPFLITFYL